MPTLRSTLNALATNLASDIVDVIRSSSLEELLGERGSRPGRDPGRPPESTSNGASKVPRTTKSGRLPRRSAAEIAAALDEIVGLVGKHKDGLRAEEIRKALKLDVREVPRVLKEARRCTTKNSKRLAQHQVFGEQGRPRTQRCEQRTDDGLKDSSHDGRPSPVHRRRHRRIGTLVRLGEAERFTLHRLAH